MFSFAVFNLASSCLINKLLAEVFPVAELCFLLQQASGCCLQHRDHGHDSQSGHSSNEKSSNNNSSCYSSESQWIQSPSVEHWGHSKNPLIHTHTLGASLSVISFFGNREKTKGNLHIYGERTCETQYRQGQDQTGTSQPLSFIPPLYT